MKKICLFLVFFNIWMSVIAQQRVVAECTITYQIISDENMPDKGVAATLNESTQTVYFKGNDCRNELVSPSFTQVLLYNKSTETAVILREFGNNKFMTKLSNAQWVAENKKYEGLQISYVDSAKTILGYVCKKAIMKLADGSSFSLYYSTTIVPSVKEYEYQFKDIPGLVFEFESKNKDGVKIKFVASKINLSPVQTSRFEIPTSGYRLLN